MLPTHIIALIVSLIGVFIIAGAIKFWSYRVIKSIREDPNTIRPRLPEDLTGNHIPLQPVPVMANPSVTDIMRGDNDKDEQLKTGTEWEIGMAV
jgi:hypothetical protein